MNPKKPAASRIRKLCTQKSFERGQGYHNQGRVERATISRGIVTAHVEGRMVYRVVLARTIRSFWRKMLLSTDHHVTLFSTSFNFSGLQAGTGDCRTLLECRVAYFYRQV